MEITVCCFDKRELWDGFIQKHMLKSFSAFQVKSFEKDRQSEKRISEADLVDHIIQKCRTKFFEERNIR